MTPRTVILAAGAFAVVAYCIANVAEVFRDYDQQADTSDTIAAIRQTGPGWQR